MSGCPITWNKPAYLVHIPRGASAAYMEAKANRLAGWVLIMKAEQQLGHLGAGRGIGALAFLEGLAIALALVLALASELAPSTLNPKPKTLNSSFQSIFHYPNKKPKPEILNLNPK